MNEFLKSITCSGTECLSWIFVLLNILAIFYLVFCSFWKVTRAAKITGWIWLSGLLCATIGILIAHTCIYTLLVTVFTAMMIMAILAVILPQPNAASAEEAAEKQLKLGAYVISKTDEERYVFALYDPAKTLIARSKYSYETLDKVKREICVCRDNGMMAAINDKTGAWIKEEYYPTFEMQVKDGKYYFCLNINNEYTIFSSDCYTDIRVCEKKLKKAKAMVASGDVYLNTVTMSGKDYEHFDDECLERTAQPIETVEEALDEEVPTVEEAVEPTVAEVDAVEEALCSDIEEATGEVVEEAAEEEATEEVVEEATEEEAVAESAVGIVDDTTAASEAFVVGDEIIYITYNRSFTAKLMQSSDEVKERYCAIKNTLLAYGVKSRISWANESFYTGRTTVAKFGIKGKTLSLYLALDPQEYEETKYIYENVGGLKKYAGVPMRMKLRSKRSVKWAKELILDMMTALGKEKKEIEEIAYEEPFRSTEELVRDGLVKVYTNGDGTETEVTAADFEALRREKFRQISAQSADKAEPAAVEKSVMEDFIETSSEIPDDALDIAENGIVGDVVFTADKKNLWNKYAELTKEQRHYFDVIRNYANSKTHVKCIEARDYLTFKLAKDKLVRLRIRRSMVEAVFMLVGSAFKNAFSEGDIKVRDAATIIRVEREAYLDVVLQTIDMHYDALLAERQRRKEEQKEKRRRARSAARELQQAQEADEPVLLKTE